MLRGEPMPPQAHASVQLKYFPLVLDGLGSPGTYMAAPGGYTTLSTTAYDACYGKGIPFFG